MKLKRKTIVPEGIRTRFLIRGESPKAFQQWVRVSAMYWRNYPGEKKIVSGKMTVVHLLPSYR